MCKYFNQRTPISTSFEAFYSSVFAAKLKCGWIFAWGERIRFLPLRLGPYFRTQQSRHASVRLYRIIVLRFLAKNSQCDPMKRQTQKSLHACFQSQSLRLARVRPPSSSAHLLATQFFIGLDECVPLGHNRSSFLARAGCCQQQSICTHAKKSCTFSL